MGVDERLWPSGRRSIKLSMRSANRRSYFLGDFEDRKELAVADDGLGKKFDLTCVCVKNCFQ